MSHPPIPPNCPFFHEPSFGATFHMPAVLHYGSAKPVIRLCRTDQPHFVAWRPIIAAVARCAWLDESERITSACGGDPFDTGVFDEVGDEYSTAIKNAESWRLWSLGQYGQELSEKTP